ncbi:MAG: sigma-54-dependent transcriptional regulator [Nitrospiraceae bacterium]
MRPPTLLIIDDDPSMRRFFEAVLKKEGYDLLVARTGEEGIQFIRDRPDIDVIVTDLKLGALSGLGILENSKKMLPNVPVIIMTGHGSVQSAVEAMRKGAYDYIVKPVDNDELRLVIGRALELRRLSRHNEALRAGLHERFGFDRIISRSPDMGLIKRLAMELAQTDATILITGESGTGKELVARAIHLASSRSHGPLIALNCAGIPEHLLESELFGYEKGAFTDAKASKPGRFQLADGGTLFLDEIGEMSQGAQAKLLRVLEHRVVEPLGGVRSVTVDIRVIAATNQDLPHLIKQGRFRLDLYYRLNVCQIRIPALRERPMDIKPLLESFLEESSRERATRVRRISPEALAILERHDWPGNVRELHNAVEWITITCKDDEITPEHLPPMLQSVGPGMMPAAQDSPSLLSFGLSVEEVEKAMLQEALAKTGGNVTEASRLLKITRNTLRYRMAKYNLEGERG